MNTTRIQNDKNHRSMKIPSSYHLFPKRISCMDERALNNEV